MQTTSTAPFAVVPVGLGSPPAPSAAALRPYLRAFLGDPRVVELPRWFWLPLLYGVVAPLRARASAARYRRIWWPEGSPLTVVGARQAAALQARLDTDSDRAAVVRPAVSYGAPALGDVLDGLVDDGIDDIVVLPLYPQYSATTTAPISDQLGRWLGGRRRQPRVVLVRDYCDDVDYLSALAASVRDWQAEHGVAERLLISFHGIPERNIGRGDPYREQCERTAAALASRLGLAAGQWAVSFQSRFGPARWLTPYTSQILADWAAADVTSVQVICPGFSADCLETLEEIAIENRDIFLSRGGRRYDYIPCLNDRPDHIDALARIARRWAAPFGH